MLRFIFGVCLIQFAVCQSKNRDADFYYPASKWSDAFDWRLLKEFEGQDYKNVLLSPTSIKILLGLLYEGSSGETQNEFERVLQIYNKTVTRHDLTKLIDALNSESSRDYILKLGTRIFIDSSIEIQKTYKSIAKGNYSTDVISTNFSNPAKSVNDINSWVHSLTNGKVRELVTPVDVDDAVMILANAIFFKGEWLYPFPRNQTYYGGFYTTPRDTIQVPFMKVVGKFFYHESNTLDCKILRLPYKGGRYSLFIMLPNSKGGLRTLIHNANLVDIKTILTILDKYEIEVHLPKFKFDFQARLGKTLKNFGLKQMFQNTASFPKIARGQDDKKALRMLVVSDILQKTGIEVDEEGSVIYAASDIQVGNKFSEIQFVFNATQPFLFFVEERATGSIIFLGKVENPLSMDAQPLPPRFSDEDDAEMAFKPAASQAQQFSPQFQPHQQPIYPINDYNPLQAPNLQPEESPAEIIAHRFNFFDLDLLKEYGLLEPHENIFISPASIKINLALVLEGARGSCAREIANALRISNIDEKSIRKQLDKILFNLNHKTGSTKLESANAVFVNDKFKVKPEYKNKLLPYNALIENLNFSDTRNTIPHINKWANDNTHGEIPQIVDDRSINSDTQIVLTNVLFFKGVWTTEFNSKRTKVECFYPREHECINVSMMQVDETFNYGLITHLNAHAFELPYQDNKYAMLVLLPGEGQNIRGLARDLVHKTFTDILDQLRPTEMSLQLPRFEIEYSGDLVRYLKMLDINEIFGSKANLTGIIAQDKVFINNIVHKTKIEVNEMGTKASAATSAIVIPLIGNSGTRIVANKPFMFFIYDKETKNIIFEGILNRPQSVPSTKTRSQIPEMYRHPHRQQYQNHPYYKSV